MPAYLTTLAAPDNNVSGALCGPFNTAMDPWSVGTHQLIITYQPTGNWAPNTYTLNLEITN